MYPYNAKKKTKPINKDKFLFKYFVSPRYPLPT